MERQIEWLNKAANAVSALAQVLAALALALGARKRSKSSSKALGQPGGSD